MEIPKKMLIKGTVILTISGIIVRIIGMLYRMFLSRLIGAEGLGLFQLILPVYVLMAAAVSFGLPGAVTKMIAERHALSDTTGQKKLKKMAFRLVFLTAFLTVIMYLSVIFLMGEKLFPDERVLFPLKLAPLGFFFAAMSQILRSYFQGLSNMTPTAVSQVIEQVFRFSLGMTGAVILYPYGLHFSIVGIMAGIICGEIMGFITLLVFQKLENKWERQTSKATYNATSYNPFPLLKELIAFSLPLLFIRISGSLTHTAESLLIPARLQEAGFSSSEAVILFGQLTGMAIPLLFLPTVFILPLNSALVPYIARNKVLKKRESLNRMVKLSLWGTMILGIFSALFLYYLSPWLTSFLYGDVSASFLVALLAWAAPFAYIQFTAAAILHGLGRPGTAVAYDMLGTLLALVIIFYLTASPSAGIKGAVVGYSAGYITTTLLDSLQIHRIIKKMR